MGPGVSDEAPDQQVDLSKIGELTADLMESLEAGIADVIEPGEQAPEVKTVAIIVELDWPPCEQNNNYGSSAIRYRCTDSRVWIQRALFTEAADIAHAGRERAD